MQCRKCGRELSDKRERCAYCGAPIDGQASPETNYPVRGKSSIYISDEQNKEIRLKDLPEQVRHTVFIQYLL